MKSTAPKFDISIIDLPAKSKFDEKTSTASDAAKQPPIPESAPSTVWS